MQFLLPRLKAYWLLDFGMQKALLTGFVLFLFLFLTTNNGYFFNMAALQILLHIPAHHCYSPLTCVNGGWVSVIHLLNNQAPAYQLIG